MINDDKYIYSNQIKKNLLCGYDQDLLISYNSINIEFTFTQLIKYLFLK